MLIQIYLKISKIGIIQNLNLSRRQNSIESSRVENVVKVRRFSKVSVRESVPIFRVLLKAWLKPNRGQRPLEFSHLKGGTRIPSPVQAERKSTHHTWTLIYLFWFYQAISNTLNLGRESIPATLQKLHTLTQLCAREGFILCNVMNVKFGKIYLNFGSFSLPYVSDEVAFCPKFRCTVQNASTEIFCIPSFSVQPSARLSFPYMWKPTDSCFPRRRNRRRKKIIIMCLKIILFQLVQDK